MPPPKLPGSTPDTLHNIVTRGFMAILGLGALTVILDPGSVKSYPNEVEYAKENKKALSHRPPHRCDDRLEDFIQAIAGEDGSILSYAWPTSRMLAKCYMSPKGQEPTAPYVVLGPWNPCYRDPAQRIKEQAAAAAGTTTLDTSR